RSTSVATSVCLERPRITSMRAVSPSFLSRSAERRSHVESTSFPSTAVTMSPTRRPAFSAGLLSSTDATSTPESFGAPKKSRSSGVSSVRLTPRNARLPASRPSHACMSGPSMTLPSLTTIVLVFCANADVAARRIARVMIKRDFIGLFPLVVRFQRCRLDGGGGVEIHDHAVPFVVLEHDHGLGVIDALLHCRQLGLNLLLFDAQRFDL